MSRDKITLESHSPISDIPLCTLRKDGGLASLVLGNLVRRVATALFAGAEGATGLGNVYLCEVERRKGEREERRTPPVKMAL